MADRDVSSPAVMEADEFGLMTRIVGRDMLACMRVCMRKEVDTVDPVSSSSLVAPVLSSATAPGQELTRSPPAKEGRSKQFSMKELHTVCRTCLSLC
jgi:hypothetical protein